LSCALCDERKEKRFCPAVHGRICPQCCGEQREVTLDCPSDCPYLLQARQQAREHAKAHKEPLSEPDREALFPEIELGDRFIHESEELIFGISFALAKSARADRTLMDRDLIAALSSLAKSYQTLVNSSLIYQSPTANLAHQAIAREVDAMLNDFREVEEQHIGETPGYTPVRDSDILKALVFLLRMGSVTTSGRPKSRGFLDSLLEMFPEKDSLISKPEEAGSRIVIP